MSTEKTSLVKLSKEEFLFLKKYANINGDMYFVPFIYKLHLEGEDGSAYFEVLKYPNESINSMEEKRGLDATATTYGVIKIKEMKKKQKKKLRKAISILKDHLVRTGNFELACDVRKIEKSIFGLPLSGEETVSQLEWGSLWSSMWSSISPQPAEAKWPVIKTIIQ
jgi:hypothetical protein